MMSLQWRSKVACKQHIKCMCWNQDAPCREGTKEANKLPAQKHGGIRAEAARRKLSNDRAEPQICDRSISYLRAT